jgi:hypothetical protein
MTGMDAMGFQTTPGGTRGARGASSSAITRSIMRRMMAWHRRSGDRFQGMDLLYLTTVGAKRGRKRKSAVARFADADQVWIEFGGRQMRVTPTQVDGDERYEAWRQITQSRPRYSGYEKKTDRAIPVIRLTRAG